MKIRRNLFGRVGVSNYTRKKRRRNKAVKEWGEGARKKEGENC